MARYTGPKTRICRIFGEPILGNGKYLTKNSFPPGQHGPSRKRKQPSEYAIQLKEKQKAKYTYGLLERQFYKTYIEAAKLKGVKGENLIKLLESRLDNVVYRLGLAASRPAARQLVSHKHITVNGTIVNIPSYRLKAGDIIGYREKSSHNESLISQIRGKNTKFSWLDWNDATKTVSFLTTPERENVSENIKEQLIVELYSK